MVKGGREVPSEGSSFHAMLRSLLPPFGEEASDHSSKSDGQRSLVSTTGRNFLEGSLRKLIGNSFDSRRLEDSLQRDNDNSADLYSKPIRLAQLENWDCGIACTMMVFRWIEETGTPANYLSKSSGGAMSEEDAWTYRKMRDSIGTESIWTADLVQLLDRLLKHEKTRYLFCSKTFQVQQDYKDVGYYQASFRKDEYRVNSIFSKLKSDFASNLLCTPDGIPLEILLNAVCHRNCIALVLVDNAVLCSRLSPNVDVKPPIGYVGHYVLLCGVSTRPDHLDKAKKLEEGDPFLEQRFCVVLCDPGQHRPELSFVMPSRFERSRRANGTDEDIIFFAARDY